MTTTAQRVIQILLILCLAHFTVDVLATTILPLLPSLETQLGLQRGGFLFGYILWRVSDTCSQMLFGYLGDRYRLRFVIWAGPLLAFFCFSFIGYVQSPFWMTALLMLGGMGVAAFHPECAAMAGNLDPKNRSRFMAMFALSGYLGQAIGPIYSGQISDEFSLQGLVWNFAWGMPLLVMVIMGLRHAHKHPIEMIQPTPESVDPISNVRVPRGQMILLFIGGVFRVMPAMGIPIVLSYLLADEGFSDTVKGTVASFFMAGLGIGGIACALGMGRNQPRLMLWLPALLATVPVVAIGFVSMDPWFELSGGIFIGPLQALAIITGLLQGIAMPVFISFAQQLMPRSQRLASSITMGVTWGTATLVFYAAMSICELWGQLDWIFWFFGFGCLICAATSYKLKPIS